MTRLLVAALYFVLWSGTGYAQSIVVRSGEHPTFTRLTMTLPEGADWAITQSSRTARLMIEKPAVRFDTSQVFVRISGKRVVDVSQADSTNELTLELGCDCDVEWFVLAGDLLVLDVKDSAESPFDARAGISPMYQRPLRFGETVNTPVRAFSLPVRRLPKQLDANAEAGGVSNEPDFPQEPLVSPDARLNISEKRLLEQIGRAANQGLLTPVNPRSATRSSETMPQQQVTHDTRDPKLPINVVAATSVDQGLSIAFGAEFDADGYKNCPDTGSVAINDWANQDPMMDQFSTRRAELYGEFDRLNRNAAKKLVQTYLHFGFGAEALNILELIPDRDPDAPVLETMARILDGETLAETNPLSDQHGCDGDVAFWSVLAEATPSRTIDTHKILKTFAALPDHLRALLGPRLSEKFANGGNTTVAATILRMIDRTESTTNPGAEFVGAVVKQSNGNAPEAAEQFGEVVKSNSEYSPRALAALVDGNWQNRTPITPEMAELAAAYATEFRDSAEEMPARKTLAIALALNGRYDAAVEQVAILSERGGPDASAEAAIPVMMLTAENADDVTFLKIGFTNRKLLLETASDALQETSARRFLNLGFPQTAMDLLGGADRSGSKKRTLLRAEAAIDLGLPHRALIELLSVSGPKAQVLRAKAMQQNGDYQLAGQALIDTELKEEGARWLWLGDALEPEIRDDASLYATVADLSDQISQDRADAEDLPPLASARALLSDVEGTRNDIIRLLDLVPPAASTN